MSERSQNQRQRDTTGRAPFIPAATPAVPLVSQAPQALQRSAPAAQVGQPLTVPDSLPRLQRQAAAPLLSALSQSRAVHDQRVGLQRQVEAARAGLSEGAEQAALQRAQEQGMAPAVPAFYAIPAHERSGQAPGFGDVAGLYRYEAAQLQRTDNGRGVLSAPLRSVQRRAVSQFAAAYSASSAPVIQRAQELGAALASVQRLPFGSEVASVVSSRPGGLPASDLPLIQRALNEADALLSTQEHQDAQVGYLHALQRQLAEHGAQTDQAHVMQRIKDRQGSGEALPHSVQRHLESGLNADLSHVRIHTDSEADGLAKGVQATAFTSGRDIYFRSGTFQPNTQSGLALLGHEVTHVLQQGQGRVGAGIDPDAGLEQQAQRMGEQLSAAGPAAPVQRRAAVSFPGQSLQRAPATPAPAVSAPTVQPNDPQAHDDSPATPTPGVNAQGFIDRDDGANLRSGPAELPGSRTMTAQPLPPGTRVFVSGTHPQKPEWLYVTATVSGGMVRGYVQNFRVTTQLPEPTATLYQVKGGEKLEPLANSIYHHDVQAGRDLRFYENAVLYVNQQAGRSGVRQVDGGVQLVAGQRIWLVSPAFANSLQGKVASGSITGGAVAKAKEVGQQLQDILASVTESPKHLGVVAGEYKDAILHNLPQIVGVTAAFLAAELASAVLATTPTGVGQLAAGLIQLGLAAWGAYGAAEAGAAAIPHAQAWLNTAWTAKGDAKLIGQASESFLRMTVQIAIAALALLGGKANLGKGMKLVDGVKITPPSFAMLQTAGGPGVAVPVFHPGSIEAAGTATFGKPNLMTGAGVGGSKAKPEPQGANPEEPAPLSNKELTPEQQEALLAKTRNWEQLKQYVGRRADPANPPPGYFYRTKNGKLELVRKNAQSGDYAPLTIKDDLVVLKSGGSNRISVPSRYRANYLKWVKETEGEAASTAAAQRVAGGNQLHHLVPDAVAQQSPLVREALQRVEGYTIDRGTNILDMPTVRNAADDVMHHGSHPKFNSWVEGQLQQATRETTGNGRVPLNQVKPATIDGALRRVEDFIRKSIQDKTLPPEVLRELEEGGMKLSYLPGQSDEAVA